MSELDLVGERRAVITGAGQSDVGRRLYRDPLELTLDACLAAIEDAGLTTADIDGISTYPGAMDTPPGFSGAGVVDVHDALRLNLELVDRRRSSSRPSSARSSTRASRSRPGSPSTSSASAACSRAAPRATRAGPR